MAHKAVDTYWTANPDGDLVCVGNGDPAWLTVNESSSEFPLKASSVANLMNYAFKMGMESKAAEIRQSLYLK